MSSAIIAGAVRNGLLSQNDVIFADVDETRLSQLTNLGYHIASNNFAAAEAAENVLLAVRPGQALEAVASIQEVLEDRPLVSICAGIQISSLRAGLHGKVKIIRAMPNLPITIGAGMTALATDVPKTDCQHIEDLFAASGKTVWVNEEQIDCVTAVSGSGPGYFFRIAHVMQKQAIAMGLSEDVAKILVSQAMLGSAKILQEEGANAKSLSEHVATPGGTTQAAFQAMDASFFDEALEKAMQACKDKAISLGRT
jgi:pyrroline-5-carboxylate reductase